MNKNISLFVLAAGMGSRYGGLKQMEGFGPHGETIIDYSIYDAIKVGFKRVVFVIRPDMEEAFKEMFVGRYKDKIKLEYVFQSLDKIPSWYKLNPERVKPWGTGHAVLMAKDVIKEPMLIINADDFYGIEGFEVSAKFLREECTEEVYGTTTYKLRNVLSDHGTVKRGVSKEKDGYLVSIEDILNVKMEEDGHMYGEQIGVGRIQLDDDEQASMNMFEVYPNVFDLLEEKFEVFLKEHPDSLTDEFNLSDMFGVMISEGKVVFKVLHSPGKWFGVTNPEDGPIVREKLRKLVDEGVYPEKLFE